MARMLEDWDRKKNYNKKIKSKKRLDQLTHRSPSSNSGSSSGGSSSGGSTNTYTGGSGGGGYGAQTNRVLQDRGVRPKKPERQEPFKPIARSSSDNDGGTRYSGRFSNNYTGGSGAGGYGAQTRRDIDSGRLIRRTPRDNSSSGSGAGSGSVFARRHTNNINSDVNTHEYSDWRKSQRQNQKEQNARARLMEAASRRVDRARADADRESRTLGEQIPGRKNYREHNLEKSFKKDLETSEPKWHETSRKSGYYSAGGDLIGGRQYYVKEGKKWREAKYEEWKRQNDHDQKEEEKYRRLAATDPKYKNDPRANWGDYGSLERIGDTVSGAIESGVQNIWYGLNNNNSINHRTMASVEDAADKLKIAAARKNGGEKAARAMEKKLAEQREKEKADRFKGKMRDLNAIDREASKGDAKMEMAKHGTKGLAKFGLETLGAITGMGVDIAAGALTGGGAIPAMVVGAAGGAARYADKDKYGRSKTMMALRSGGIDAAEKQQEENRRYAALSGAIEGLTEKIFAIGAPMKKLVGNGFIGLAEKDIAKGIKGAGDARIRGMARKLAKSKRGEELVTAFTKAGISMTGEGLEEVIAGVLNPIAEKMTIEKDKDIDWGQTMSDALHDGLIGAAIGGVFGGAEVINQKRQGKFIRESAGEDKLIQAGLRSNEGTKAHQLATDLLKKAEEGQQMNDYEALNMNNYLNESYEEEFEKVKTASRKSNEELKAKFGEDGLEKAKNEGSVKNQARFRMQLRDDEDALNNERGVIAREEKREIAKDIRSANPEISDEDLAQEVERQYEAKENKVAESMSDEEVRKRIEDDLDDGTSNTENVKYYEDVAYKARDIIQDKLQANYQKNIEEEAEERKEEIRQRLYDEQPELTDQEVEEAVEQQYSQEADLPDEIPELSEEYKEAAFAIADIAVGEADLHDYSLFSDHDPVAREALQEALGVELPEGNEATRDALIDLNMKNRQDAVEIAINEKVTAQVKQQLGDDTKTLFNTAMRKHNVNPDRYATAFEVFRYYYNAGHVGSLSYDKVPVPSIAKGVLPKEFLEFAYKAGRRAGVTTVNEEGEIEGQTQQEINEKNVRKAKQKKKGNFTDNTTEKFRSSLKAKDKKQLDAVTDILKGLSEVWKVNIALEDPSNLSNGYYKNNTIHVNANLEDILMDTFLHEFMHHMEKVAPKEWKAYADFVAQRMNEEKPGSFEEAINKRMRIYSYSKDTELESREDARREVIADSTRALFEDKDFPKELARHDASMAAKIADVIKKIIEQIKQVISDIKLPKEWREDAADKLALRERQRQEFAALWKSMDDLEALKDRWVAAAEAQIENETTRTAGTQYALTPYNEKEKNIYKGSKKIILFESDSQVREFAEKAQGLSPENNEYKMFYFGKISENTAHRIKNDLGKNHDFSNHNLSISNYEIKKIYKDHSKSKEVERGQKIIEPKDFIKIPEVVSQYTSVVESGDYNGNPTFIFSKEYENGEKFNVVAYESKGRHLIIIQTMYINKKMSLADPTTEQATVNTPEASIGTASFSNKSIAQESEKDNENKEKQMSLRERDEEYMKAVESGDMETAQRMVDEAAKKAMPHTKILDEDGNPLIVYHGSSEDFTVFDRTKGRANMDIQGMFFSPWDIDAGGYGENVRRFYLNITNPASEGEGYKALNKFAEENNAGVKAREYLISKGYDGVNNSDEEYVAFESNQIKSADPVTYDDNGNVIPLSERFNPESDDIRYQVREDSDGNKLSQGQQEYFKDSKVRDDEGRLMVMYHGSQNSGFTVFDPDSGISSRAFFFADSNDAAKGYSGTHDIFKPKVYESLDEVNEHIKSIGYDDEAVQDGDEYIILEDGEEIIRNSSLSDLAMEYDEYTGIGGEAANYAVYLNVKNPLIVDAENNPWDEISYNGETVTSNWLAEHAREEGCDGLIIKNVVDSGLFASSAELAPQTDVVVFDSNQIKSIDNQDPTEDPDIRYSIIDDYTDNEDSFLYDSVSLSPERLDNLIREYAQPGNMKGNYSKAWIATIDPRDFLKLTVSDYTLDTWTLGSKNAWGQEVRPLNRKDLKNEIQMPFLEINSSESNSVIGHEGRHRMLALWRAGYTNIPVVIIDTSNKESKEMMRDIDLWSQDFGKGPVNDWDMDGSGAMVEAFDLIPINEKHRAAIEETYVEDTRVQFSVKEKLDPKEAASVSYAALVAKPDMSIVRVVKSKGIGKRKATKEGLENIKKNAETDISHGLKIYINDTGRSVIIGRRALEHSLDRNSDHVEQLIRYAGDYLKNSIRINFTKPVHKESTGGYILLSYGESEDGEPMPAYFVVDTLKTGNDEVVEFDRAYAMNGKKIGEAVIADLAFQGHSSPTISIKELLEIVNEEYSDILSDDVLEHFGAERKNTKLGKNVKYSLRESIEDYEEENRELRKQVEKLRSEMKLSHGKILADKDATRIARHLLELPGYLGGLTLNETNKRLKKIYTLLADDETLEEGIEETMDLAADIVANSGEYNEDADIEFKSLSDYLRSTPIYVSDEEQGDLGGGGKEEYTNWRKSMFGVLNIRKKGAPQAIGIDQFMIELRELFPGAVPPFDPSNNSIDQFKQVLDYREEMKKSIYSYYNPEEPLYGKGMTADVAGIIFKEMETAKPGMTFADRKKKEKERAVQRTKDKAEKKISKLNTEKRDALEKLKEEYKEKLQKLREEKNASTEQKLRMRMQKEQERDRKRRERVSRKKLRASIERDAKQLSDMLLKPTDKKHLPKGYDKAVAALLSGLDFETVNTDAWTKKYGEPSQRVMNLRLLREEYAKIVNSETSEIEASDYMMMLIDALSHKVDGQRLSDLDTKTLSEVRTVVKAIKHQIQNINRAFSDGIKQNISELGEATIDYMKELDDQSITGGAVGKARDFISVSNAKPIDFFDRVGSPLQDVFNEILKGEDAHIRNVKDAIEFIQDIKDRFPGKKPFEKWSGEKAETKTFTLKDGSEIELTPAQIMSLYALNKREQARKHMFASGIVVAPVSRNMKNKLKKKMFGSQLMKTHVHVTYEDVLKITGSMTNGQKMVADRILYFLNNQCAAWGNETSMKLYGYEAFREKNYFPIKSSEMFLNESTQEKGDAVSKLKNTGFTKATQEYADNPIVIDDFFRVTTGHINTMSMYNAFVPAITDFERVYNYNNRSGRGIESSVKQMMNQKYGNEVTKYINTLLQDLNTQYNRDQAGLTIADTLLRRWKQVKIGANARVLLQQPTAITRAQVYIDYKYLAKGIAEVPFDKSKKVHKRMWETCPIAYWKHLGFAQTDISRDMMDILMSEESLWNKATFGIYGAADDITWTRIFAAVEAETRDKHPELAEGSQEWKDHVNERFRYIVDRTQVVDSTLHRSQLMRSKQWYMKSLTSFMAEPTTQINMWMTMIKTARDQIKAGDKGAAARTMTRFGQNYLISMITLSLTASLISAMRESYMGDDDDDDDKDKTFLESWIKDYAVDDFTANINILNQLPWTKDVISLINGYDVERADMSLIADAVDSIKRFKEYFDKNGDVKFSWKKLLTDAVTDCSALFGVPAGNIERDAMAARKAFYRYMKDSDYAHFKADAFELNPKKNKNTFIEYYLNALESGDKETTKEIKTFLNENKISQEDIDKAVSRRLNDEINKAIEDKDPAKMKETIRKYKKTYNYTNDAVSKKIRNYFNDEIKKAVEKGDIKELDKITKKQAEYGVKKNDIESSVSYWTNRNYKIAIEKGDIKKQKAYDKLLRRSGMSAKEVYLNRGNQYIGYYDMLIYNAGSNAKRHKLAREVANMFPDMTGENYILDFVGTTKSKTNIENWKQRKWTKAQISALKYRD